MSDEQTTDLGLPTVAQREVGGAWLRKYGHLVPDDPDFCAAAIYRLMMLAKLEPSSPELAGLLPGWREREEERARYERWLTQIDVGSEQRSEG